MSRGSAYLVGVVLGFGLGVSLSNLIAASTDLEEIRECQRDNNVYACEFVAVPKKAEPPQ